jgi:hypothetical protein
MVGASVDAPESLVVDREVRAEECGGSAQWEPAGEADRLRCYPEKRHDQLHGSVSGHFVMTRARDVHCS